jgi:hypothetical protein
MADFIFLGIDSCVRKSQSSDSQMILERVVRISGLMKHSWYQGNGYNICYSGILDSCFCLSVGTKYGTTVCYYPLKSNSIYCEGNVFEITGVDPEKISFKEIKGD